METAADHTSAVHAQPAARAGDDSDDLGPNGLPYARCPPASNEWARMSRFLATLPADPVSTMHPSIVARPRHDVGGGLGLFCTNGLAAGEVVWAERRDMGGEISATPRTRAWVEALPMASQKAYCHFMYKTGEDEYQSLAEFNDMPIDDYPSVRPVDVSNYMNHSCNPSCWFVDGGEEYTGLMVAARDLLPGDEITYDYCTSEDCELSPEWQCNCGAGECRNRVTPRDWQLPSLQTKYAGHFLPHIASKIAEYNAATSTSAAAPGASADPAAPLPAPVVPLARATASSSWWVRQLVGECAMPADDAAMRSPERQAMLARRAVGLSLDTLNRQAAMLIVHYGLKVRHNEQVGGHVVSGNPILKGDLVMLLPPNLLLWDEQVEDFNTCLQVGRAPSEPAGRLFSSSITRSDIDNYLCHSCEPNCRFVIGEDLACGLVARRDIAVGEAINFDYDTTEDDLRDLRDDADASSGTNGDATELGHITPTGVDKRDRGGFECHCGAPLCRRLILGRLYSPPPGGPAAGAAAGAQQQPHAGVVGSAAAGGAAAATTCAACVVTTAAG